MAQLAPPSVVRCIRPPVAATKIVLVVATPRRTPGMIVPAGMATMKAVLKDSP